MTVQIPKQNCTCNYYFTIRQISFSWCHVCHYFGFFFIFVHMSVLFLVEGLCSYLNLIFFLVFVNFEQFFQTDDVRSDSSDVTRESSDWKAVCELVIDVFSARFADYNINIFFLKKSIFLKKFFTHVKLLLIVTQFQSVFHMNKKFFSKYFMGD